MCGDTPSDCEWDASAYGAADCDAAYTDFGLSCAQLELFYGWDCSGCNCPGDISLDDACTEGYCPEGTYFDGAGCYDCDYCLNTFDDSACSAESGLDCAGAYGGGDPVGCSDDV